MTSSLMRNPNLNLSKYSWQERDLCDGYDSQHWLVVMEKPEGDPTRDEIIDSYVKTMAMVVGSSEEEARMNIYSVSIKHYFAFAALMSEDLAYRFKELPKVRWVLHDVYVDEKNKDYGGEPFINGQAVPYDPKYHASWLAINSGRANIRNKNNQKSLTEIETLTGDVLMNQNTGGPMQPHKQSNMQPHKQSNYSTSNAGNYTPPMQIGLLNNMPYQYMSRTKPKLQSECQLCSKYKTTSSRASQGEYVPNMGPALECYTT